MRRVSSAPNLSVVDGTGAGGALLPSNAEKRNHAAIEDGFRQSPPPPSSSVKRNRVESVQQPLKPSPPPSVEENRCNCVGIGQIKPITLDDIPEYAKQRYLTVKERFGALWDQLDMGSNRADEELIGDIGFLCPDPEPYPYLGCESDVIKDTGFLSPDPEAYQHIEPTPDDILELFR